ncbi:hypothetical protein QLQ15_03030 [Lysobacter sp. LF1]|uniref:Polymer-forming cytoskeletal protein n=1 Tax=Lysobacter stagni TaxID=3045172 RepID=A0ABT6XCL1_9GAMM|nr:hypothetical protein [Lysobacter sp. LF1]MDI9237884.1 hypothetical protein [Lysobacter sp. LF1]
MSPALVLPLALALAAPALAAQDVDKVNGSITVEAGQEAGDLSTVNGSIKIGAGARTGKAETVNGSISVAENVTAGGLETVNGSIRVSGKGKLSSGLETVNGGIFVDRGGDVRGDIETVNGAIGLVDTDLSGGITTVNGDVTVGVDSHVKGGIHYTKPSQSWFSFNQRDPKVIIGPNAVVDGPLVFERKVELYVHSSAKTGPITGASAVRFDGATPPGQ